MIFSIFAKSLARILSPDIGFYDNVTKRKGYFKTITLTLTSAFVLTLTLTLILTQTLTQAVENKIFVSLFGHVTKTVFHFGQKYNFLGEYFYPTSCGVTFFRLLVFHDSMSKVSVKFFRT